MESLSGSSQPTRICHAEARFGICICLEAQCSFVSPPPSIELGDVLQTMWSVLACSARGGLPRFCCEKAFHFEKGRCMGGQVGGNQVRRFLRRYALFARTRVLPTRTYRPTSSYPTDPLCNVGQLSWELVGRRGFLVQTSSWMQREFTLHSLRTSSRASITPSSRQVASWLLQWRTLHCLLR